MSTLTTINASDNITNSRAVINANFLALNNEKIETSTLDTDTTLAANSDLRIPTQKAVKAYVDTLGNVNASTTQRGIVEEATTAEAVARTAAGGSGARLFINPSSLDTILPSLFADYDATNTSLLNSTTETTVYTKVLPTSMVTGTWLKLFGNCSVVWDLNSSVVVTVTVKINGTAVASIALDGSAPGGAGTGFTFAGTWQAMILNISTVSQKAFMSSMLINQENLSNVTANVPHSYVMTNETTSAIDTTGTCTITVTYQSSNAIASRGWNHLNVSLERFV